MCQRPPAPRRILVVGAIYFPTGNGFTVDNTTTTCISASLAPGASCTIAVHFGPNTLGSPTNVLTVLDNTATGTETANVSGTTLAPYGTLSTAALTFSSGTPVGGQSAPQTVMLSNTGTAPLTLRSIAITGNQGNGFTLSTNACPAVLAVNSNCILTVAFTPQVAGLATAQISIVDDNGGQLSSNLVTQTVTLNGISPTPVQSSSFSIANTAFASTASGASVTQNVLLTLHSPSTVLSSIAMAQNFAEYFVNSVSGCTVDGVTANPAGTVCSISVSFSPTSVGLQHNATLLVTTVEGAQPVPYAFGLSGQSTGIIAALTPGLIGPYVGPGVTKGAYNPLSGMNGPAINAVVGNFSGFALDSAHDMYVSDSTFGVVYKVTPQGIINVFEGIPYAQTYVGDGVPATQTTLIRPSLLALDQTNNLYIVDSVGSNHAEMRKVDAATNLISAVLSTNALCSAATDAFGDGCAGNQVNYTGTVGMAFGPDGNLYFATGYGIHQYNTQTGLVTLFAGTGSSTIGTGVDGGAALGAKMTPSALTFDNSGNLLFIDNNVQVRAINSAGSMVSTVAGLPGAVPHTGYPNLPCTNSLSNFASYYSTGNGGPATSATFCQLTGVATDPANNIYVVDFSASEIRRIDSGTGTIVEVSGQNSITGEDLGDSNEIAGYSDGSAREASLGYPMGILVDGSANIYEMGLTGNVRMINVSQSALDFTPNFYNSPPYGRINVGIGSDNGPLQVTVVNAGNTGTVSFNAPFNTAPMFGISTADYVRDTANPDCLSTNAALKPGTECPLYIDFTPTIAGSPILDTETVNDTGGTQSINLIGYASGTAPVTLTPGLLVFGGAVGVTTLPQTFTLTNNTPGAIGIGSITLIGVNPGAFLAPNNCGSSLAASSSCQISVTFTAPALAGCTIGVQFTLRPTA